MTAEPSDQPLQRCVSLQWQESEFNLYLPHVPRHVAYQQSCLINPCKRCVSLQWQESDFTLQYCVCLDMLQIGRPNNYCKDVCPTMAGVRVHSVCAPCGAFGAGDSGHRWFSLAV